MKAPRTTIWSISGVTRTKHTIFKQYLQWWLPRMINKHSYASIIDGFAGPGEYEQGDHGSPLIALDVLYATLPKEQHHHVRMLYIEKSKRRATHLRKLIAKTYPQFATHTDRLYHVTEGMFVPEFETHQTQSPSSQNFIAPAFIFVDPFGFKDIPLTLLANCMKRPHCDLLFTFMYEEVNRFLGHPQKSIQRHFDTLFGTHQWRDFIDYQEREEALCNLYVRQMKQVGNMKYACKFRMKNSGNTTDYFLFFFTNNRDHLIHMKHIFWEIDTQFGSNFNENDRTALQPPLFPPQYTRYKYELLRRFCKQTVWIETLDEYALAETIFCQHRYKEYLLKPLEQEALITVRSENPQRLVGHYTEQERIYFH